MPIARSAGFAACHEDATIRAMSLHHALRAMFFAGCLFAAFVPAAGQAAAAEERMVCAVGSAYLANSPTCMNEGPPSQGRYSVVFELKDEPDGVTDYAWTVTPTGRVQYGCTATTSYCVLSVPNFAAQYDATVTYSYAGVGRSFQSTAFVEPWCGSYYC